MATLKPLRPLQFEGQNLYPLTTYDQIIMSDGKKWNGTVGADVVIEPTITSGTKLATVSINGVSKDLYYQASAVTLNGTATTNANFYAPTAAGTIGQVLQSNGNGVPSWTNASWLPLTGGTLSGQLKSTSNDFLRSTAGGYGVIFRNDGNYFYMLLTDKDDPDGGWNDHRPLYIDLSNGWAHLTGSADIAHACAWSDITSKPSYYDAKAIKSISRSGTTFTATHLDGTTSTFTQQDNNTTYSAGTGLSLSGTTFSTNNNAVWMIFDRNAIGISPNFDDPGFNGLFELRTTSETTGETGIKPYNGFGPFISLKGSNTMFQLAGTNAAGFYIRGKQAGNVTLADVTWQKILTDANWSSFISVSSIGAAPASHTHSYLPLSGGVLTSHLFINNNSWPQIGFNNANGRARTLIYHATSDGSIGPLYFRVYTDDTGSNYVQAYLGTSGDFHANTVYGAVYNDYAEYRSQNETIEPGYITYCDDDGKLKKTVERLQKFEGVVSDTFGFAIGETDNCKTPLAVSGRVLVYCDPEEEHFHSGDCVCAGPDGLAYRMTREEVIDFPDRIVGVVSEIPTYETWGTGNVKVDGRIWIKVK